MHFAHAVHHVQPTRSRSGSTPLLNAERELVTWRDEAVQGRENIAVITAERDSLRLKLADMRRRMKKAKKSPSLPKQRRVKGGLQLCNLRKVNVESMGAFRGLLQQLVVQGMVGSTWELARRCNISRPTARLIVQQGDSAAVPRSPHPNQTRKQHKQATILTAWASLDRPATDQLRKHLLEVHGLLITQSYLRRLLRQSGLRLKKPVKNQMLSAEDKARRLQWCQGILAMSDDYLLRIAFTDEKYFELRYGISKLGWAEKDQAAHVQLTVQRAPKQMMWLAIGAFNNGFISPAFFYAHNSFQTSELYIKTLQEAFVPVVRGRDPPTVLMHDGAPSHTAAASAQFISASTDFVFLQGWPPRSPDLNPIENLWWWIVRKLDKLEAKPRTLDDLRQSITTILGTPEAQEVAAALVRSFRRRCEMCVHKKGEHTGY